MPKPRQVIIRYGNAISPKVDITCAKCALTLADPE